MNMTKWELEPTNINGHVEVASPSFIWLLLQKNKITLQLSEVLLVHTHTVTVGYRVQAPVVEFKTNKVASSYV